MTCVVEDGAWNVAMLVAMKQGIAYVRCVVSMGSMCCAHHKAVWELGEDSGRPGLHLLFITNGPDGDTRCFGPLKLVGGDSAGLSLFFLYGTASEGQELISISTHR